RASCILSLRSSDRGSLISLPCNCQGLAFAAVGITYLDFDRSARWKNIAGHFREDRRAVVAPRLSMVGDTADDYRDAGLHALAVHDQLAILCLVTVLRQGWLAGGYSRGQPSNRVQSPPSDEIPDEPVPDISPCQ